MVKFIYRTAETWVVRAEKSSFKNILMLGDCAGEKLTLKVVLRYGSRKLVKTPSFGYKLQLWCVITKNGSFGELGHQGFIAFLVIDWVYYRFVTVRWRLWRAEGEYTGGTVGARIKGYNFNITLRCLVTLKNASGKVFCFFLKSFTYMGP